MNCVSYEWDAETTALDENGEDEDVLTHNPADPGRLIGIRDAEPEPEPLPPLGHGRPTVVRFCLVRNVWNEHEGLVDRSWAYAEKDGKLPEFADELGRPTGKRVPKKLRLEWEYAWHSRPFQWATLATARRP